MCVRGMAQRTKESERERTMEHKNTRVRERKNNRTRGVGGREREREKERERRARKKRKMCVHTRFSQYITILNHGRETYSISKLTRPVNISVCIEANSL